MGILQERSTGRRFTLGARCLIGRHEACDLRLVDARVSSEHASLHWIGDRWELRDLGSRNGTFVGERRVAPGERIGLVEGAVFSLGAPGKDWALADASPPTVGARNPRTGERRSGAGQLLVLPDDDSPLVSIFEETSGRWVMESGDAVRPVRDHEPVIVAGESWILELPASGGATLAAAQEPVLEDLGVRVAVSRDEEHVEVTLIHGGRAIALEPRTYHYLLLVLARLRAADTASSQAERGWVERDELCRMLSVDELKLNTDVCRLRKQVAAAGVHGAAGIIARRPGSGQLRLGIDRVEIAAL